MFEKAIPSIYEPRWGYVVEFVRAALPLLKLLRRCWDKSKYGGKVQESGSGKFDPELFSQTLSSQFFFVYCEAVMALHLLAEDILGFIEGCPCHEAILKGRSASHRAAALSADYQEHFLLQSCCMAGCRAAELAGGDALSKLDQLKAQRLSLLQSAFQHLLTTQSWQQVMSDYDAGACFLRLGLSLKLSHWRRLPWAVAGLSHHFQHRAREIGRHCLRLLDAENEETRQHRHPLVQLLLVDHRGEVELFLRGRCRSELSQTVQSIIASTHFWPCSECCIEGTHSSAKKFAGLHRSSALTFSIALRSRSMLASMCRTRMQELLQCIGQARNIKQVVHDLGLAQHPDIAALLRSGAHSTKLLHRLGHFLYRGDMESMFMDTARQQKRHERKKARDHRAQAPRPHPPTEVEGVLLYALVEHLRSVLASGQIISYPRDSLAIMPVAAIAEEAHAATRRMDVDGAEVIAFDTESPHQSQVAYAKVLHLTPHLWRTVPMKGSQQGRVSERALALAPMTLVSDLGDVCILALEPGAEPCIAQSWDSADLTMLQQHLRRWDPMEKQDACLVVPGACPEFVSEFDMSNLITSLLTVKAVAGAANNSFGCVDIMDARMPLLQHLARGGYLHLEQGERDCSMQLTRAAVTELRVAECCTSSPPLCAIRPGLAPGELSDFELIQSLQQQGWLWRPMPRAGTAQRKALRNYHREDDEKIWCPLDSALPLSQPEQCLLFSH